MVTIKFGFLICSFLVFTHKVIENAEIEELEPELALKFFQKKIYKLRTYLEPN